MLCVSYNSSTHACNLLVNNRYPHYPDQSCTSPLLGAKCHGGFSSCCIGSVCGQSRITVTHGDHFIHQLHKVLSIYIYIFIYI